MILSKGKKRKISTTKIIEEKISTGKLEELLLIVPTNRKVRTLRKELISKSPGQVISILNVETLSTLSVKIIQSSGSTVNLISEAAATVLLKQSFKETPLKYFNKYKDELPKGSLSRIKSVLSEYKRNGISPEKLLSESKLLSGSEKSKAEDIAAVYSKYKEKFKLLNVKETGDLYEEVIIYKKKINQLLKQIFPLVNTIIIEGFSEFTLPEIEIIDIIASIEEVELFIDFDYNANNPGLYSHLDDCYNKFYERKFFKQNLSPSDNESSLINYISSNLFNKNKSVVKEKADVSLFYANSPEEEIELIAKEIKRLIIEEQAEPHKICLAFNLISKYSPLIRDIFSCYGLPFNLTDRYNLSLFPSIISLINLLEVVENDFYYKNIFRAFSSGYLTFKNVQLHDLIKTSSELKIISGYRNWIDKINLYINSASEDEDFNLTSTRKTILLEVIKEIESLNSLLKPFKNSLTVSEFRNQLNKLIADLEIPETTLKLSFDFKEENIKAITTFIELTEELFNLLELEYGLEQKFPLRFFLTQLSTAIATARFNVKEKSNYGVLVTNFSEIRGLNFDYLFLAGMSDGDFPTRYMPEIFFSGSFTKKEYKHRLEERYLFYQVLKCWNKKLYFSYPLVEGKKETAESNFITEFKQILDVKLINRNFFNNKIYSFEELSIAAGKYKDNIDEDFARHLPFNFQESIEKDSIRRDEKNSLNQYNGFINENLSENAKQKLAAFLQNKFSISQLETYAVCPFKYFAERVLYLEPITEPKEEIEAIEMGSLLHSILFEFYKSLKSKKITLQGCDDKTFSEVKTIMIQIAKEKTSAINLSFPLAFFEKEKILGIEGNFETSILYTFLEYERNNSSNFSPSFFEISFGNLSEKTSEINLEEFKIQNIALRGKIDRIDVDEDSQFYKVIDYKLSGKKPTKEELLKGLSLQLPVYMIAAKKILEEKNNLSFEPAAAEIYSLKPGKDNFGPKPVKILSGKSFEKSNDEQKQKIIESNNQLMNLSMNKIVEYVNSISEGKFNLSTLPNKEDVACKFCNFYNICRIKELNN